MINSAEIREVLKGIEALSSRVDALGDEDDLFAAGLCSFGSVQLMLALEERFEIEFPDHLLNRRSFASIAVVRDTVASLVRREAA